MYAIVDIETTGNGYRGQKITEISIFVFDGEKIVNEFTSLVNPESYIPPFITNLTGITNQMVQEAPKFYEIAKQVEQITKNCVFVAHSVNFDYNIIQTEYKNLGFNFKRKKLCTVRLSRKIIPGLNSYSLGNICASENIIITNRHRAHGDAEATLALFKKLLNRDQKTIEAFLNNRSRQATIPPLLSMEKVENLPQKFGVYYFKNSNKDIIYVGKANNIKQRVISHFYNKKKKEIAMCLETADITFTETGSELLALLLESSEIKKLYPKYNRAQRRANEAVGLFSYTDKKGIIHLAYNRLKLVSNPLLRMYSNREAILFLEKLCEEFELCPKYCHLQTNVTCCFHYQIKKCKGICRNKEDIETYNNRVLEAINTMGLSKENMVIIENGRTNNERGFVLVVNGIYKGFGYVEKSFYSKHALDYLPFTNIKKDNRDVQRILLSYLRKKDSTHELSKISP